MSQSSTRIPSPSSLRPREDHALPQRIARSRAVMDEGLLSIADFHDWFAERAVSNRFKVERVRLDGLDGWSFEEPTGNLVHHSGRFFTVEGLHVSVGPERVREWYQPIIKQSEVGILGILVKEFDGVLHCLMQAKMEPGNPNLLQLSPTVQATFSNYTRVHGGSPVRYLDYFAEAGRARVLADVLQSEHGAWFYRKSNRNMIVETDENIDVDENFCWLTFGQLTHLMSMDNLVNMDSRTVLSCSPVEQSHRFGALHSDIELLSWFTAERAWHDVRSERVGLSGLPGWVRDGMAIEHSKSQYFRIVGVSVEASNREVITWSQPLIEPVARGIAAFVAQRIYGVPHVLVHARVESGFVDTVELAPTVQCIPENYNSEDERPMFLDLVLAARPEQLRYTAVHSEEGGRFLNAESRYMIVETDLDEVPLVPPRGFFWVTAEQLTSLVRHGHYLNVQARTLLACLNGMGWYGADSSTR